MAQQLIKMNHLFSGISKSSEIEIVIALHFSFLCDEDGWTFNANKEPNYPHFFHPFSPSEIVSVHISGDLAISYVGFGSAGSPFNEV